MLKMLKPFMFPMFSFAGDGEGGTSEENPGGQGEGQVETNEDELPDDEWVSKRGAKNVREESKRKSGELKTLKEEYEALKAQLAKPKDEPKTETKDGKKWRPDHLEKFSKKWVEKNYDPEFIEDAIDAILTTAVGASNDISQKAFDAKIKELELDAVSNDRRITHIDRSLETLSKESRYKLGIERYKDEIIKTAKERLDPKFWKDSETMKYIVSDVIASHLADFGVEDKPAAKVPGKVNETGNNPSGKGGGIDVTDEEIEQAALTGNLNLSDPQGRSAAKKIAQLYKLRSIAKEKAMQE